MNVYAFHQDEIYYVNPNGSALVNMREVAPISYYNESILSVLIFSLIPFAFGFCTLLFLSAYILWKILQRIQLNNDLKIVEQLNGLRDGKECYTDNPALQKAYDTIRQRFEDNTNAYRRLNSYLSHEQKNAIAILRTTLELTGDTGNLV